MVLHDGLTGGHDELPAAGGYRAWVARGCGKDVPGTDEGKAE
jgi:hypothetical protein